MFTLDENEINIENYWHYLTLGRPRGVDTTPPGVFPL